MLHMNIGQYSKFYYCTNCCVGHQFEAPSFVYWETSAKLPDRKCTCEDEEKEK